MDQSGCNKNMMDKHTNSITKEMSTEDPLISGTNATSGREVQQYNCYFEAYSTIHTW